jgi:2-amino-4-hydroxy-6-hydroxymethyldihydropteridine diphosphokinase
MSNKIFIGLGSNLGNSIQTIEKSIKLLISEKSINVITVSSVYLTEAIGYKNQPDFLNAVCCVKSRLSPLTLLKKLLQIEDYLGRTRTFKNAPRCIDLDLLIYKNIKQRIDVPINLVLPHPEIHKRAFVLKPLIEIEPDCEIPGLGKALSFVEDCKNQKIKRSKIKLNI